MRYYIKGRPSVDYPSPAAAAVAASFETGKSVEYDHDGEGFVSPGNIVSPVAVRRVVQSLADYDEGEGDIW